jgi:hypothetical protein
MNDTSVLGRRCQSEGFLASIPALLKHRAKLAEQSVNGLAGSPLRSEVDSHAAALRRLADLTYALDDPRVVSLWEIQTQSQGAHRKFAPGKNQENVLRNVGTPGFPSPAAPDLLSDLILAGILDLQDALQENRRRDEGRVEDQRREILEQADEVVQKERARAHEFEVERDQAHEEIAQMKEQLEDASARLAARSSETTETEAKPEPKTEAVA